MHATTCGDAAPPCPVPCDLCGGTNTDELSRVDRRGAYLRTVICRRCGLVFSDPRPSSEAIRDYYEHSYRLDYKQAYQPDAKHIYRAAKVAVERVRSFASILREGDRVLDFGAGAGEVVYVLRTLGYDATGFEPNVGYCRFASETLGLPVTHGLYQKMQFEPESYDVVVAFHVFEHLESPLHAFSTVHRWLRCGGRLLVEVPNVEATCQWPRSRFHSAHLYNFNPASLEMAGQRTGYAVVSTTVSSDGGNVSVLFQAQRDSPPVKGDIPGNYERVRQIVRRHKAWRHFLTPYPYVRPLRKLLARWDERSCTKRSIEPRQILDFVVAKHMSREPERL